MKNTMSAVALLATVVAAPAFAQDLERTFERDGVTYTYVAKDRGDRTVLTGRTSQGNPFHLVVRGDRVSGFAGGKRVAFNHLRQSAITTAAR